MSEATQTLDMEALKNQNSLTPEQEAQIEEDAIRKMQQGASTEDAPDYRSEDKEEAKTLEQESSEEEEESKDEKEEQEETQEEDSKEEEEKPTEEKKEEEKSEEKPEDQKQTLIETASKALAEEKNIPLEDAKKAVEGEYAIAEKYQLDPFKMARAYRGIQALYSKSQEVIKGLEEQMKTPDQFVFYADGSIESPTGQKFSKTDVIEQYRAEYPETTKEKSDEEIYEMAKQAVSAKSENEVKVLREKRNAEALVKKVDLLESIPTNDKQWAPEIKEILNKSYSDEEILSPKFDLEPVIRYTKGGHYDEDIKAARDEGYAKGKEEAKILGEKTPPIGSGSTNVKKKKGNSRTLSPREKERAIDMFGDNMKSDEECQKAYLKLWPDKPEPGLF